MLMDVKKRPESTNMTVSVLSKIMQGKVHFHNGKNQETIYMFTLKRIHYGCIYLWG